MTTAELREIVRSARVLLREAADTRSLSRSHERIEQADRRLAYLERQTLDEFTSTH